jgi:hypothetical protein
MILLNGENAVFALVFGAIKLLGYYFLVRWMGRSYRVDRTPAPLVVALSRIALGAIVAWLVHTTFQVEPRRALYPALIAVRMVEWALVVAYFYERHTSAMQGRRLLLWSFLGTVVSCVLDIPAFFGAIVTVFGLYGFC